MIREEKKSQGKCLEILSYLLYTRFIPKNFKVVVLILSSLFISFFFAIPISVRMNENAFDYKEFIDCEDL